MVEVSMIASICLSIEVLLKLYEIAFLKNVKKTSISEIPHGST